tara:strand:+ start:44509 stop:46044 length:1536 start_codon:yes stop_codon:yes gene_type:complete
MIKTTTNQAAPASKAVSVRPTEASSSELTSLPCEPTVPPSQPSNGQSTNGQPSNGQSTDGQSTDGQSTQDRTKRGQLSRNGSPTDSPSHDPVSHGRTGRAIDSHGYADATAATTRLDPISGEWTIYAPDRSDRPDEFRPVSSSPTTPVDCPFCQGNESETPEPVWVGRDLDLENLCDNARDYLADADAEDWSVRVVPNKFPAVAPPLPSSRAASNPYTDAQPNSAAIARDGSATEVRESAGCFQATDGVQTTERGLGTVDKGLFQCRPSRGGHEVIIESPRHVQSLSDMDRSDACLVLLAYRDRIRFWRTQPGIQYISVFKNVGPRAGASLSHFHSQLIATNQMPSSVAANAQRMSRHQANTGCCLQCDLIRGELKQKTRIVAKTDSLIAYCPFASRLPMLVRISTIEHMDCFESLPMAVLDELSQLISRVTAWLNQIHPGVSYNYILHTRPPGLRGSADAQHWAFEIFPRLTQTAGFEWGSRAMINPVLPENAAAKYRECATKEDPRYFL